MIKNAPNELKFGPDMYKVYQKNKATTKFKIERKVLKFSPSGPTGLFLTTVYFFQNDSINP